MLQFARSADVGMKRLRMVVVAVAAMRLQDIPASVREHVRTLFAADVHRPDRPFVAQMFQVVVRVPEVLEIALPKDAKRTKRGERAAVAASRSKHSSVR